MTRRLTLLCAIFAGLLILGCDRRDPPLRSSELYDPEIDPPASILEDGADPDLIADQAAISRRAEREKPEVPEPVVPAAPSEESATDQVTEKTAAEHTGNPMEEAMEETTEAASEAESVANSGAESEQPTGLRGLSARTKRIVEDAGNRSRDSYR